MRSGMPLRVVLYSHDALGLGHLRRNLLLARTLTRSALAANVLMITGTSTANRYPPPPNVDFLTLPAISKRHDGRYAPRSMNMFLAEMIGMRSRIIKAAIESFAPDLMIVDNVPRGIGNELDETLLYLRSTNVAVVLGLRDILDEPAAVQLEWTARANADWISACFEQIWVYGDRGFFDPVVEYGWTDALAAKVRFVGYLDRRDVTVGDQAGNALTRTLRGEQLNGRRVVLCMVGGGQDGDDLADAFTRIELPVNHFGVVLTGPFMSAATKARLRARIENRPDWKLATFHSNPAALLHHADAAIAMGGYNTVSELLSHETPALIAPRIAPRREQWIRADRLRQRGLISVLEPAQLSPDCIAQWIPQASRAFPSARMILDFNGLTRLPQLVGDLAEPSRARQWG